MAFLVYIPPIVHDQKVHETLHVKVTGITNYGVHPVSVDSILFELVEKDIEDGVSHQRFTQYTVHATLLGGEHNNKKLELDQFPTTFPDTLQPARQEFYSLIGKIYNKKDAQLRTRMINANGTFDVIY